MIDQALLDEAVASLEARVLPGGLHLALAESCTAGLVAASIATRPGVSRWLRGSAVVYGAEAKTRLLGIEPGLLAREGAVSEAVARAMAESALHLFGADRAGAVTGVAGPGPEGGVPAGTVWLAVSDRDGQTVTRVLEIPGDRAQVREAATLELLALLAR